MFEYEITVTLLAPVGKVRAGEVFTIKRHAHPDYMREIVRRLRLGYPATDYAVTVDIIDVQRTTVIEE